MGKRKNDNVIGKGNRFSAENQPKNRGRKPGKMKEFIRQFSIDTGVEISKDDFIKLYSYLLSCNIKQIKELDKNEDLPISIKTFIRAMHQDMAKGEVKTIELLWDKLYGREKNALKIDINSVPPIIVFDDKD